MRLGRGSEYNDTAVESGGLSVEGDGMSGTENVQDKRDNAVFGHVHFYVPQRANNSLAEFEQLALPGLECHKFLSHLLQLIAELSRSEFRDILAELEETIDLRVQFNAIRRG